MSGKSNKTNNGMMKTNAVSNKKEDRRSERSKRSKKAICKAMVDLVNEGNLMPTAKMIADNAGVSVRLIFHHFEDLETIRKEVVKHQSAQIKGMIDFKADPAMPLSEKTARFVSHRTELLEFISPVRKLGISMEPHSTSILEGLKWIREFKRHQVETLFGKELSIYSKDESQKRLSALKVALSWPTWNSLREHQELDVDKAKAVIEKMVQCILGSQQ